MAITETQLRIAAVRAQVIPAGTLAEARGRGLKTAFLCHSHRDRILAEGLVNLLAASGWRVYVDWQDSTMPDVPDRETAERIQQKIIDLDFFLFLATANSSASRWCPWEIGYADGNKPIENILVIPTSDNSSTHGNEYMQLYRRITFSDEGRLGVWRPGESTGGILLESL